MFVSCLSEIDVALSQVNVLLSEVNSKLESCPAESRRNVLSRLSNILSEMMWAVSLSSEGSSESECDATSYSADVESLSWDNSEDLYRLYYDDDEEEEDENGDHGPIQFSDDPDEESSPPQSEINFNSNVNIFKKKASPEMALCAPKSGPPVPVSSSDEEEDDVKEDVDAISPPEDNGAAKFVTEMSVKIANLAPGGERV